MIAHPLRIVAVVALAGACRPAATGTCAAADPGALVVDEGGVDDDEDGLSDDFELALARAHLPFLAHHPDDRCPLAGILFRAHPHPGDAALVHIVYDQLFALDCGLDGHVGDDEVFGATIDPALPPPAGLTALVAISHQGTPCERVTTCGTCPSMNACDAVAGRAVVYSSKDKHGTVVDVGAGCSFGSCLESCALPVTPAELPLVNAGEPDHPLVDDLTAAGLVGAGWDASLQHVDPWAAGDFGGAGAIAKDLVDDAFVPPACRCRE